MAAPRRPRGRQHWLKAIGSGPSPIPGRWLEEGRLDALRTTGFPRRPRIAPGDRLVYYASGWRRVFALVEAVEDPAPRDHPRWPWTVAVAPLVVVCDLDDAPPVEAIGVAPRSMSQQSHIALRREHYELAVEAIGAVGG